MARKEKSKKVIPKEEAPKEVIKASVDVSKEVENQNKILGSDRKKRFLEILGGK